jgi:hypothetical protein
MINLTPFFSNLPLTINEGIYSSIAQKISHGGLLYQDAWDHKPPLVFLAYFLAGFISPNIELQAHALAFCAHIANAIVIVAISRRLKTSLRGYILCGLFYVLLATPAAFQPWSGQADLLMQPFLLMALFLAMSSRGSRWFASGVFWATAFFFKQSALFYLPLFVYLSWDDLLTLLADFFWGVNALSLIVIAPFLLSGRLGLFWQAVMGANGNYVESGWVTLFSRPEIRKQFFDLVVNGLVVYGLTTFAIVGFFIASIRKSRSKGEIGGKNLMPILFFVCSLFSCCVSGSFYSYYFVAVMPGLALMVPACLRWLEKGPRWQIAVFLFAIIVPEVAAAFRYSVHPAEELDKAGYSLLRMQAAKDVGEYLKQNGSPSDSLVLWASEPQIYSYSGLQFRNIRTPLVIHLYMIPGEEEKFEDALRAAPPDWFVVGHGTSTPQVPQPVNDLLRARYHRVTELGAKEIYRRI